MAGVHTVVLALVVIVLSSQTNIGAYADQGIATFYGPPYIPSACYQNKDDGVHVAAASDAIWGNKAACGRFYKVTCLGAAYEAPNPCRGSGTITVKIVDYCPPGCAGTIDLSRDAFSAIADPVAGKIKVSYEQV